MVLMDQAPIQSLDADMQLQGLGKILLCTCCIGASNNSLDKD